MRPVTKRRALFFFIVLALIFVPWNALAQYVPFAFFRTPAVTVIAPKVDDAFSAYTYTGAGGSQTIINGIDLAGQGGMTWIKLRDVGSGGIADQFLFDTTRGVTKILSTNQTYQDYAASQSVTAFNSNGFTVGTDLSGNGVKHISWTFREAPKFFDVITYNGNGTTQAVVHSLGVAPGMVVIKRRNVAGDSWPVWHRGMTGGYYAFMNTTAAQVNTSASNYFGNNSTTVDPSSSDFTVGSNVQVNASGSSYIAYLFAHDPDTTNGVIQAGSFTTDGSGNTTVNLGWEPQYVLVKNKDDVANWRVWDSMRDFSLTSIGHELNPNTSGAEDVSSGVAYFVPTATGYKNGWPLAANKTFIYLAIRRSNKPPTSVAQVYNTLTTNKSQVTQDVTGLGFSPDFALMHPMTGNSGAHYVFDKLRGPDVNGSGILTTNTTNAETGLAGTLLNNFLQDGIRWGDYASYWNGTAYFFKRAPGVFDVVAYTGDAIAGKQVAHNLSVPPELIIVKSRTNGSRNWAAYSAPTGNNTLLYPNLNVAASVGTDPWNNQTPTSSVFYLGNNVISNTSGDNYIAYLFASNPGISKVGSYTGDGSTGKVIDAGFTGSASFILIKRTDAVGDWYVWNSARGITVGNDPHISLNTTAAEVTTDDSIGRNNSGFAVNQNATTNINVTSATYIYYAVSGLTIPTYTITSSAGTNGAISPSGAVTVYQGDNQTFTITPNSGYIISSVTVDSVPQAVSGSYTFTNVQAAHTISATFAVAVAPYADDAFSAYTYSGTGASHALTTGIDLSTYGGMFWDFTRSINGGSNIYDTARGGNYYLSTDGVNASGNGSAQSRVVTFNSDGVTLGADTHGSLNYSGRTYVGWTFRKAPKFFDVVTWTGNGGTQALSHNLGVVPGMVVIKRTDTTGNWPIWHRSLTSGYYALLNTTAAQVNTTASNYFGNNTTTVDPTSTQFTVGSNAAVNASGGTYVAYLFAHDPDTTNGIIQCGSWSTDVGFATLGWEPQFMISKGMDVAGNWVTHDVSRVWSHTLVKNIFPNLTDAETNSVSNSFYPYATGFASGNGPVSKTYIYCAIRRPNKPPTSATQVLSTLLMTGDATANRQLTGVGFVPDLLIATKRNETSTGAFKDRLRGKDVTITSINTYDEATIGTAYDMNSFNMDGVTFGASVNVNESAKTYAEWFFRRAPGVFDEVAYTGTGVSGLTVPHSLGVVPEFVIVKSRTGVRNWEISDRFSSTQLSRGQFTSNTVNLQSYGFSGSMFSAQPTVTALFMNDATNGPNVNTAAENFVAYLFATKAGISKVGSYTGNGTSQTIDAGFTGSASYILIKRTDTTGDWYVWDNTRGIVGGNDPHLSLNTTASEVTTDDSVDPNNAGFVVNQNTATNINVGGGTPGTYIYLAFAGPTLPTFNITSSAGTNGAISPSGVVSVTQGGDQTFTITPDSGYVVSSVTVDSVPQAAGTSYTFTNVQATHTISVTFVLPVAPYADDAFSAYTYTGNNATQTITNGINLAGQGGLVWIKNRTGVNSNMLFDTARRTGSFDYTLSTDSTGAQSAIILTAFSTNSNGFYINNNGSNFNASGNNYASWTFRKAPKFFDVVTYTGNGTTQTLSHNLGIAPGTIIIKRTDAATSWPVWNRGMTSGYVVYLNTTGAQVNAGSTYFGNNTTAADPTSTQFTVGSNASVNASGGTYVAYIFAHDTDTTNGIIQTGSFTTDGSGLATTTLGWEPQLVMVKAISTTGNWLLVDSSRGMPWTYSDPANELRPNLSSAEATSTGTASPRAAGFFSALGVSQTYVYLAIRRPNKPLTAGTQVYNAITRAGTGAAATVTGVGFAPDLILVKDRTTSPAASHIYDRLRGASLAVVTSSTSAESGSAPLTSINQDGMTMDNYVGNQGPSSNTYINWFIKRSPGVFDEISYTGMLVSKTEAHSLGTAPELWIVKDRGAAGAWTVGCANLANTEKLVLNTTAASATDTTAWNSTFPTASVITLGTLPAVNNNSHTYVAYLFATKAGISKVGSYTGNGTSQTINAGFTGSASYILIKRTDTTGDWYVWDNTRGIVGGNDPHLSLNTTVAEVTTDDSIDPDPSNTGFVVNQNTTTNINVSNGTYIYLAFAGPTLPTFNITSSAGTNGAISPSGTVPVIQGDNQTFTITPNSGYVVSSVTVDSVPQAAGTSYTFTNVQATHTISATFAAPVAPYTDDAFSAYTYTGTGATKTITNGIDLTQGGLVWTKLRSGIGSHQLFDSARGVNKRMLTDTTDVETSVSDSFNSFNSTGYTLGADPSTGVNGNGSTFVSWTFRKAPKFFDVQKYTGNGATQALGHNFGIAPGMIIIKRMDAANSWAVWHRSLASGYHIFLNTTAIAVNTSAVNYFGDNSTTVDPTSSQFTVGSNADVNASGGSYVAYLFAHDPDATNGIIQAGSYTGNGSTQAIDFGFEPQFWLLKAATGATSNWLMTDTMRGAPVTTVANRAQLFSNTTAAEGLATNPYPTSTGFYAPAANYNASGSTYIYLAIRRPNKPPTSATQVYNAIARVGNGTSATITGVGFAPDLYMTKYNTPAAGTPGTVVNRLSGRLGLLATYNALAEDTLSGVNDDLISFNMDGATVGAPNRGYFNNNSQNIMNYFFRRAPGVFDEVAYTGTGSAATISHNLGVAPELMLVKARSIGTAQWVAYAASLGPTKYLMPSLPDPSYTDGGSLWNLTAPTASAFSVLSGPNTNNNGATYIAYLFASKAGISKVGSYTGNGTSQTIDAGFTGSASYILIKRTDTTGDWYLWDNTRGIVAGNDPHLSLNTTAVEVTTDDSVGPNNTGFVVNQNTATNINVNSGTYVYLAFAGPTLPTFNITSSAGTNGAISPSGTVPVIQGDNQTFTITPNSGYARETVLIDGTNNPTAVGTGTYTFTNVQATHTISATFTIPTAVDDVFSEYTYTGNGSTQTITNGIDLTGQGGMVWTKSRSNVTHQTMGDFEWVSFCMRFPNLSVSQCQPLLTWNSNGYNINSSDAVANASGYTYVSWTFRKAPKFYASAMANVNSDAVVSFPELGAIGMVVVQGTYGNDSPFWVWHRSLTGGNLLQMNTTGAQAASNAITVSGTNVTLNASAYDGGAVIVYAWAHDIDTTNGIIQAGSFTTDGSGVGSTTLGWEPQFILVKRIDSTGTWFMEDSARGFTANILSNTNYLSAEANSAENAATAFFPTATGFGVNNGGYASRTFVYLAIRRPNKPPTSATQVMKPIARTSGSYPTGQIAVTGVGFAPDMMISQNRTGGVSNNFLYTRLQGVQKRFNIYQGQSISEKADNPGLISWGIDGFSVDSDGNFGGINFPGSGAFMHYMFKRAVGVFDVVVYTGTGANTTISHNLGVAPELWFIKDRTDLTDAFKWQVGSIYLANNEYLDFSTTDAKATGATRWNSTYPTASVFSVGTHVWTNTSNDSYLALLFASKSGISKVGTYTGNGSNQTINAGFASGARFVMIKRTDVGGATSEWYVWDTARGIVAGSEYHLTLENTTTEVGDDSIDPDNTGFIVNQLAATNINVNGATYIYLAFG